MLPLWFVDVVIVVGLLLASEAMYRLGRARKERADGHVRSQVGTAQASTLGLLALIMGFTLSMAESRFSRRRALLVEEANAIGTTYLRMLYLPEPVQSQSRALLRDYVAARRAYADATPAAAQAATARSQQISAEIWARAMSIAPAYLDSEVVALYLEGLNEMIDLEASRDIAANARVPWTIDLLLVLVALVAVGITGYASGLGGGRVKTTVWLLPVLIALGCAIVLDLDRARAGYIQTGDEPMHRLERQMSDRH